MAQFFRNPFGSSNQGQPNPATNPTNQQPQPNNNQNSNMNANPNNNMGGNLTVPNTQNQQNQGSTSQQNQQNQQGAGSDPLIDFNKLWQNNNVDAQGNPVAAPAKKSYVPQMQPEQLQQVVGNMDFTRGVMTPERVAALTAGGEGAVAAINDIINGALRQATMVNFNASTRIMSQSLDAAEAGFLEKVPTHVRDVMTTNALTSSNPLMQDPTYGPLIDVIRGQIQSQFPKATPDQVQTGVNKYFDDMYAKMSGIKAQKEVDPNASSNDNLLKTGSPDADWGQWMQEELARTGASIFGNDGLQNQVPPNQQQNQQPNPQPQGNSGQITF